MARYSKKRKYNNKYNNYSWNTFKKSNSVVSRAWKSIKEANKSNTQIDFAFKINYAFNAFYKPEDTTNGNPKGIGVAAINVYQVLLKSENFKNMMKNYDQVKVNGVTCRLNVCDATATLGNIGAIKSINVVTGWDKTGLSVVRSIGDDNVGDVEFYSTALGDGVDPIEPGDFDDATKHPLYFRNLIGARLAEGYGCKKGLLNSYQRFSRFESCFPSTMDEKTSYVPTSNFNEVESGYNYENGAITISGDYKDGSVSDLLTIPNPCLPFEQLGFNWKPTLLVGVFMSNYDGTANKVIQYGACDNVIFNGEFTIPVTFKGQKGDS
jgi:hypothetical protein